MNNQMILLLDSIGFDISRLPTGAKVVPDSNTLKKYIYENIKKFDSISIYASVEDIDELVASGIWNLEQVKRVICCCDSLDNMRLAVGLCHDVSNKFDFCLKTEVENRIKTDIGSDLLNSSMSLHHNNWSTTFADKKQQMQMKEQNLAANESFISLQSNAGFDARNKDVIDSIYFCRICSLILRDPVQLDCGHRQCKSCVEAMKGEIIKCPECQEETQKKYVSLDRGLKNDMQSLAITCSLCNWKGILKHYEDHLAESHPNPSCEYCGKTCDSANNLNVHKLNECDKRTVHCVLKDYGCSSSVLRCEMDEHYKTEQHQNRIIAFLRRDLSKFASDQPEGESEMDVDTLSHTTTSLYDNSNAQLQEVCETTDVLADGIRPLNEEAQRMSDESLQLQNSSETLTIYFPELKLNIQEQSTYLNGLKPNQEILHQDVPLLKQKVEDSSPVSYDGTLTWKISNFAEKMADAQSERQTSIHSPIFYSSPTGYKMRARLYLHGDGNALGTHMSLFFLLMRSEYDAILQFPFSYKLIFCLYDQTPAQRHIIDSFRPDIKSNSFQRPRSEMNIASGIPKFVPLAMIQQEGNPYVRNDKIIIKVIVDFGDMFKTMLSYALSLNPELPLNVQETRRRMEMEKDKQLGAAHITEIN